MSEKKLTAEEIKALQSAKELIVKTKQTVTK